MLYQLGGLQFRTTGLGPHEVKRSTEADYAEKDVVGAMRPAEFVGEGHDEICFRCCLPSQEFGGLTEIALLDMMRSSGQHFILVRGDGWGMGWRRIVKCEQTDRYLDGDGLPNVIEYEISMRRGPAPSFFSVLRFLYTLLS